MDRPPVTDGILGDRGPHTPNRGPPADPHGARTDTVRSRTKEKAVPDAPTIQSSAELREAALTAADRLVGLRSIPEERRPDSWATEVRAAVDELNDTNALFDTAVRMEQDAMQRAAWDAALTEAADPNRRGSRGPDGAFTDAAPDARSAGAQFVESDEYRAQLGEVIDGGARELLHKSGSGFEVRNLLTGSSIGTSGSNVFAPVGTPYLQAGTLRMMRFFMRDVLPVQNTGLQTVPYIKELNAATNETGATTVQEASAKPEVTMEFTSAEAPIRKIAAWIQVTEEAYADAPTLQGYVDTRLAYMLQVEEEDQLLQGNGTAPNISGITDQSGVQTQSAVADDLAGTIGLAIAKIENVDGDASFVAINPITFWTGVVERHSSQMDGGALASGNLPWGMPPTTLFGLPAIRSRVFSSNKALVGAGLGATIFERSGTTIRSTDSHASLFISNTLVVLAEKRTGLAVHRPDWFVDTTLSFS